MTFYVDTGELCSDCQSKYEIPDLSTATLKSGPHEVEIRIVPITTDLCTECLDSARDSINDVLRSAGYERDDEEDSI